MTTQLIGDREKLREVEQRIRGGLTALARHATGRGSLADVVVALCPQDVDPLLRDDCFRDLMRLVREIGPDLSLPLPYTAETDLNQMTGKR